MEHSSRQAPHGGLQEAYSLVEREDPRRGTSQTMILDASFSMIPRIQQRTPAISPQSSSPTNLKPSQTTSSSFCILNREYLSFANDSKRPARCPSDAHFFHINIDVFAQILSFLNPSETLRALTLPICKDWVESYTSQRRLWKILCSSKPFKARGNDTDAEIGDLLPFPVDANVVAKFGAHRLMYTSFVRCTRYLLRIQKEAKNGNISQLSGSEGNLPLFKNVNLESFLTKNKELQHRMRTPIPIPIGVQLRSASVSGQCSRKRPSKASSCESIKKPRYGNSMITTRLLGATPRGKPAHLNLPKSCAIFSIVNWMMAYPDVEGIQVKCFATLPCLLENESQRVTAQRVGLIRIVFRAMLRYLKCLELHIAAFHTLVLLGRPLGGREGMLFDTAMSESPIRGAEIMTSFFAKKTAKVERLEIREKEINGIEIMLDSMRRFEAEPDLQAMACWALVNLALVPVQKNVILSLNGIHCTLQAMKRHPHEYDVQFRALFALINLVVLCKNPRKLVCRDPSGARTTEKDVLDEVVHEAASLVVLAMKNFCSSATILNRACLILHNLSQSDEYLQILLTTPHCYQMLEWCIANYPTDQVLQKGAMTTFQRFQLALAQNETLRYRFLRDNELYRG